MSNSGDQAPDSHSSQWQVQWGGGMVNLDSDVCGSRALPTQRTARYVAYPPKPKTGLGGAPDRKGGAVGGPPRHEPRSGGPPACLNYGPLLPHRSKLSSAFWRCAPYARPCSLWYFARAPW